MDKLIDNAVKELKQIEEAGLSSANIDNAYKLSVIAKNLYEVKEEEEEMREPYYDAYRGGMNGRRDHVIYDDGDYYGRRDSRGRYRGEHPWDKYLDHMVDGADMYRYGRQRYMDGGSSERMHEGLEKLMYGVCMFVESAMDFAETPEEKEIIRKHIHKMKNI